MTQQIKVEADGNWAIENGNLVLLDDVAQRIRTRLLMLLGEWFLDTSDGTAYFQKILVKDPNLTLIRAEILVRVRETPGVTGVSSIELDFDRVRRSLTVTVVAVANGEEVVVTV